jgi:hypothetical protein
MAEVVQATASSVITTLLNLVPLATRSVLPGTMCLSRRRYGGNQRDFPQHRFLRTFERVLESSTPEDWPNFRKRRKLRLLSCLSTLVIAVSMRLTVCEWRKRQIVLKRGRYGPTSRKHG